MINQKHKKIIIEHNEEILREIWNRIMIKIWSIIPTTQNTLICKQGALYSYSYLLFKVRMLLDKNISYRLASYSFVIQPR